MKSIFLSSFLFFSIFLKAQENVPVTNSFTIEGEIKKLLVYSLQDMKESSFVSLDSVVIYNHLMQFKKTIKSIKGVLLKDILSKVEFDVSSPRLLSEFYIVCVASDNYKVVFSWNEIFNSDVGKQTLIITGAYGKDAETMDDRIALLSPADYATGRRYVKGLQKIIIKRVN